MKSIPVVVRFACGAALLAVVSACGQYGDLYLPEKPAEVPQQQPPASGAASGDRTETHEEP